MSAVMHYMEQHLTDAIDIDALTRKACMSKSKLYVEFKKQLGCTPGEYQQQRRLKKAGDAIRQGTSITEACFNYGFNDLSHFSRRFKQLYGCTPTDYKHRS